MKTCTICSISDKKNLILIVTFSGMYLISLVIAEILILFSLREAVCEICVAYKLYPFIYNILYNNLD